MVMTYSLELVDEQEVTQNLYCYKPYKEKILFHYLRNDLIEQESKNIQNVSL